MVLFVCVGQIPQVLFFIALIAHLPHATLRYLTNISNCLVAACDLYIYYSIQAFFLSYPRTPEEVGLTTFFFYIYFELVSIPEADFR